MACAFSFREAIRDPHDGITSAHPVLHICNLGTRESYLNNLDKPNSRGRRANSELHGVVSLLYFDVGELIANLDSMKFYRIELRECGAN